MFHGFRFVTATLFSVLVATACQAAPQMDGPKLPPKLDNVPKGKAVALFAGGCFWCMEGPFDRVPGVLATISGYTDGVQKDPTYRQVSSGQTGHTEAIQVIYDPAVVSYDKLLDVFWHNIDPTAKDRQFCDAGTQYRSGIYGYDDAQLKAATASKAQVARSARLSGQIYTEIKAATRFYPAEEYHQDFYRKNPTHYYRYRAGCGRDARLKEIWGTAPH